MTTRYLVMDGPYAHTRNPMYVAERSLWLGWAMFFGSRPVLAGAWVLWAVMSFAVVPWEERVLAERFDESYLDRVQEQGPTLAPAVGSLTDAHRRPPQLTSSGTISTDGRSPVRFT
jgi:hypothetical protein